MERKQRCLFFLAAAAAVQAMSVACRASKHQQPKARKASKRAKDPARGKRLRCRLDTSRAGEEENLNFGFFGRALRAGNRVTSWRLRSVIIYLRKRNENVVINAEGTIGSPKVRWGLLVAVGSWIWQKDTFRRALG